MSTGTKVIIVIIAMFFLAILKQFAPILAPMIGAFILISLFSSKKESHKTERRKDLPENDNPIATSSETVENIIENVEYDKVIPPESKIESKEVVLSKAEILYEEDVSALETDSQQTNIEINPIVAKVPKTLPLKFEKTITQAQKIIFSLSVFAVLLVICYAIAESIDYKMRMKETWFIWVVFILTQAWFQNKFWSTGSKFEIAFKAPNPLWVKSIWSEHKRKVLATAGIVVLIVIIAAAIEPLNNYFEERAVKQKELARIKYEDSITTELNRTREYNTHLKTSEDTYDLSVTVKEADSKYLNIKIKAENGEFVDENGEPVYLLIRFGSSKEEQYAEHIRDSRIFYTDFSLIFHSRNYGDITYHVNSESMNYDGDYEHYTTINGKRFDLFPDKTKLIYHTFTSVQNIDIEGRREAFLSIDSVSAIYN